MSGQLWIGLLLFFVMAALLALVWYGTRLQSLTITTIEIEGGETISHQEVRRVVEGELQGEYYRLVPRRFSWFYPQESIVEKIKMLPRVSAVTLDTTKSDTLSVHLEEYEPFALWCGGSPTGNATDPCVFLDDQGYAFATSPALIGTSLLRYHNGKSPTLHEKPFGPAMLMETSRFVNEIGRRFGLSVSVVEWIGQDDVSFSVRGGGILKTTLRQPVDDTLENLSVILSSEEFKHLGPGDFSYIDFRFGDKVFVNEDGASEDSSAVATSSVIQ